MNGEMDEPKKIATTQVLSEYAEPSCPDGAHGVRHPISAAPVDPPKEQPSNVELEKAVRAVLAAEGRLTRGTVFVSARYGVVTLNGEVPFEYQRELAKACAEKCSGVLVLVNELRIG